MSLVAMPLHKSFMMFSMDDTAQELGELYAWAFLRLLFSFVA
jgi:hypothetical protein